MKYLFKKKNLEVFPISLILFLVFFRIIPHPPNFTPIIAVAIMSGYFFRNIYLSIFIMIFSMLLSDLFIGFYKNIFFVYLSLFLIILVFFKISNKINFKNLFLFSFFGSLIFYLISNFGVWAIGSLYEKNLEGLITCYYFAIPFFKNTLLSTIIFSYVGFFANFLYNQKVKIKQS